MCKVQNRPAQNVPLWHVNYFELKVIKTLQAHEKLLPLLKEFKIGALPAGTVDTRNNFE